MSRHPQRARQYATEDAAQTDAEIIALPRGGVPAGTPAHQCLPIHRAAKAHDEKGTAAVRPGSALVLVTPHEHDGSRDHTADDNAWGIREIPPEVYDLDRENFRRMLQSKYPGARVTVKDLRLERRGWDTVLGAT